MISAFVLRARIAAIMRLRIAGGTMSVKLPILISQKLRQVEQSVAGLDGVKHMTIDSIEYPGRDKRKPY
jgi:hypothetical protein